jgi:hypothetical protein
MKRTYAVVILIFLIITFSGCSLIEDIISDIKEVQNADNEDKDKDKDKVKSPYSKPEVLCAYFHYFRADTFAQWWYPGNEPDKILGPEPWRRNIWIGRSGDYPYIGIYDNVTNGEIMRWHIRLAKASGITAFLLYMYNWQEQLAETQLMLDIAAQENFKIGFCEHHSYLGATSRSIFDGRPYPILSSKYVGYDQIMDYYSQKLGKPLPSEKTRYVRPVPRQLRDVSPDALKQATTRIVEMLKQWKSHPAYLRIDGKPSIAIPYMDMELTSTDFKTLVDGLETNLGEDLYVIAIIPFVYWYFDPEIVLGSGITREWANTGTDSFTHWVPVGMITASQRTRLRATQFNVRDSLKWKKDPMIPVMPGADDDTWRPGDHPAPTAPRNNGQAWSDQLDAAITAKPRFIFIQAWNEWHEGSQIEPSTFYNDPYLYLKILAQKLEKPWQAPPLPPQNSVDSLRLPYLPY